MDSLMKSSSFQTIDLKGTTCHESDLEVLRNNLGDYYDECQPIINKIIHREELKEEESAYLVSIVNNLDRTCLRGLTNFIIKEALTLAPKPTSNKDPLECLYAIIYDKHRILDGDLIRCFEYAIEFDGYGKNLPRDIIDEFKEWPTEEQRKYLGEIVDKQQDRIAELYYEIYEMPF